MMGTVKWFVDKHWRPPSIMLMLGWALAVLVIVRGIVDDDWKVIVQSGPPRAVITSGGSATVGWRRGSGHYRAPSASCRFRAAHGGRSRPSLGANTALQVQLPTNQQRRDHWRREAGAVQ